MLDLKRLRVLREVARQGSFSGAAVALSYTQPAVSRQIATLEREINAKLIERSARGVRLTDAGAALVAHADEILGRLADAEEEVRAIGELRGGRLRMAAFPTAAATIAPLAIARFRASYPEVSLSLTMAEPGEGLPALRAGELDIALSLEGIDRADAAGTENILLFEDPMYLALPVGHRLASRRRIRLADFRDEEWMLGTGDRCPDARLFKSACAQAGFEPKLAFQNDDYSAIQGFIAAGVGIALIPDLATTTVRDDVVLRSIGPRGPARRGFAATKAGGYRSPSAAAMLGTLLDESRRWVQSREASAAERLVSPDRLANASR
ncbi:MAG: LysR family transcriptional regulator [Solirubrobacteraceae bacterium]